MRTRQSVGCPPEPTGRGWIVCLAAFLLTVAAGACERDTRIVIGVPNGVSYIDAARLAVADENLEGALSFVDTVMLQDESNRAAPAITAADRLVKLDGLIAVVGHSNSAASLAAAPIYNEHAVVQIAPHSSATLYSQAGPFSFRLVPPDDQQGAFLADHLARRIPGEGRLAVMYVNDDYGRSLLRVFLDTLDTTRFEVVARVPHNETGSDSADIAHQIASAATDRPDLVLWLGRGTVLHRYLPPLREALGEVPVVGSDATSTGRLRPNDDGRWDGVVHADFVDVQASPASRDFAERYRDRFGQAATGGHALAYDAVRLVFAGIRGGARSGPELRGWLLELGRDRPVFRGVTGPITFEPNGDVQRSYVMIPVHGSR